MIRLDKVRKEYRTQGDIVPVLKDVTFSVDKGEMVAIMGRSGSGKSTLLNIIGGITEPTSGEIWMEGKRVDYRNQKELYELRRNQIGYVVQNFALIGRKSVLDNVILPVREKEYKRKNYLKVKELLEELGLRDKIHLYPYQLSNGEKQRVAIARALVDNKKVILADEPTGALDYANAENTVNLFRRLREEKGLTILIVTHDQEIADRCDRIIRISYGEIEKQGVSL